MLNDKLRPQTNKFTNLIGEKIEIDPNIVTIIGLFISIFSGVLYASGNLAAGALFIILSGFCDMIDGAIARSHNRRTKFGGFLDSTCDRFADAAIIIGIIYSGFVDPILGALAIHSSISMKGLKVVDTYTTTNEESSSKGAITLTCTKDGETVDVRTIVLTDKSGNVVKSSLFAGKTIDVKGVIDYFSGRYQIKVYSLDDITIH